MCHEASSRQAEILKIIQSVDVETQEQLLDELKRWGFASHSGYHFPGHQGAASGQGDGWRRLPVCGLRA